MSYPGWEVSSPPPLDLGNTSYRLDSNSLDTVLLTCLLHVLRRLNTVEVVDSDIGAFTGKCRAEEFAEATGTIVSNEFGTR
jgi:hypothetical protein